MLIISDEIYRDLVHYRSRTLHRKVSDAVAQVFTGAGVPVPAPQAGFYLYPDFGRYRDHLRRAWSIHTGTDLAAVLLHHLGIATLPGSAFGDHPRALRLRIATSLLYGHDDEQRDVALHHPDPSTLPWITHHHHEHLHTALGALLATTC